MKVFCYVDARYVDATWLAAGVGAFVMTSPPFNEKAFVDLRRDVESADLLWFNFHALPGMAAWNNTAGTPALTPAGLAGLDLKRAVVFMINCYAGGGMLDALKATRARAIIGGEGENFGGLTEMAGADLFGEALRQGLAVGMSPHAAVETAKIKLRIMPPTKSIQDALEFKILWER